MVRVLKGFRTALAALAVACGVLAATDAQAARGRPSGTGPLRTFVTDTGTLMRGPRCSTEVGNLPTRANVQAIKAYGGNALHVYAERSDYGYAAGARAATLDTLVQWTRDDGLYLIITIGNGGLNTAFINDFWNFYAGRYANETHVLYEIQNEVVSTPGVSATVISAELNAYNIIRSKAPNTPVLFFSYVAFNSGAKVIQDINALGTTVDWTKAGIAFHGYGTGGPNATKACMQYVQNAGYNCFQTEFYVWPWGLGNYAVLGQGSSIYADTDQTAIYERLGCSWLSFLDVSQLSIDARYKTRFANAGVLWTPDYGTWPSGSRGTYGNNNEPWTQTGLTGTLRIEAENFDIGGEGLSFHDNTSTNTGGSYRTLAPDVQTTTDTGGGYNLSYFEPGEWVEYTTYINDAGSYNMKVRVAATAASNSLSFTLGGSDLTGTWSFAGTGGFQTWTTITKTVFLTPGQKVLRMNAVTNGVNVNWIEFTPVATGPVANGTYKIVARSTGKVFDVVGSSTANLAKIQQWGYSATANQKWTITHLGGSEYKIVSAQTGKAIDIASYNLLSGDYVQMYNSASSANQRYILTATDSGYYTVRPAINGLALEITGASTANGAIIDQSEYTGATSQQWAFQAP